MRATVVCASNRAAAGIYEDTTGPLIVEALQGLAFEVTGPIVVPDGPPVADAVRAAVDSGARVVLTSGGTGLTPSDRTPELIPLCHPLAISGVTVDLAVTDEAVQITARVRTTDRTGVEMEALTAVSVAALTVVDMVKAVDKAAVISDVRVETKTGGKSGDWSRS